LERLLDAHLPDRFDECPAGLHRPLRIILVCLGIAEIDEYAVTHVFGNKAIEPGDHLGNAFVICTNDRTQIFGIEHCRQRCGADQITEYDGQLATLGVPLAESALS
jgi:hypothetical protein